MKKHLLALMLFIGIVSTPTVSTAQSIVILQPNELYKAPPKVEMIVMDIYTFGNYHYTASQYDTLKQEVKRLDDALVIQDSLNCEVTKTYESMLALKQSEVHAYQNSYSRLEINTNECIKQQNQLQVDYNKIEQKNKRVKRWRNFFMGTSAVLGTIVVLSVIR